MKLFNVSMFKLNVKSNSNKNYLNTLGAKNNKPAREVVKGVKDVLKEEKEIVEKMNPLQLSSLQKISYRSLCADLPNESEELTQIVANREKVMGFTDKLKTNKSAGPRSTQL